MSDPIIPTRGRRSHRRRRRSSGRVGGCLAVVVALAILAGVGAFAYVKGRDFLEDTFAPAADYDGPGSGQVLVEVKKGDTTSAIGATLKRQGVVASVEAFTDEASTETKANLIQAGFYELAAKMSARDALDRLIDPKNVVQNVVTIPEGYTVKETLARIAEQTEIPLAELEAAARKPAALGLPEYAGGKLEGLLFPATYPLPPNATAAGTLKLMVSRFKQAAEKVQLAPGAEALGMTPMEALTVASIVEAEARNAEDFPKVSRVIHNRLDVEIRLQMDSTVHFAVGKEGDVTTTEQDRASKSPYNTYRVTGLPPGPIDSPGESAMDAAIHPAEGDWLYFVTVNLETGETKYASDDTTHAKNVAEYHTYCRSSDAC
ncbi:MAG: endolytic transglycosylase MltG [Propionibacteriales bacterium]|nr:endolytic transglycosylase MltG [Propionibacteriales bacterium]